ncbi:4-hydroxyphenylacetate 3-hydroxylase family protein [Desulfosporosinus nitroreducens]|uniref:4-hydroxyphenylacetate 3-hydroxylase family protein n=1 Tax=Desulfosporosinus nitroreducens TaxID=2018668 RepID=UPI00207C387E|nr:4-hydroxyphenylacetate 3-hydroxylase N-terminal domain-containing protein [Desulfosporosinus nitroreducens]MCO1599926.1 aromatic ring hydroxylase [Desulfosporosinus nitroreducens]
MRTSKEYREKILSMRPNVYMNGKLVGRDHPDFEPGIRTLALTYDLVDDPEYADLLTATSHLSGEKINRFTHMHQSTDDLLKKQEMTRKLCLVCGRCIQRCMGIDAMNGLSLVTKDIDNAKGTNYHERFLKYLRFFQDNDLVGNAAQSDVKGDRNLRPHQQADPDLYLHIVERREDGIVVRGAKAHNSIAAYADELIVIPTRALTKEEGDWAVAFAIQADAPGIKLISLPHNHRKRKHLKAPIEDYGTMHALTVFDNVFVPWDRVFMNGETEFAGQLASQFATYHRHSYTGCKPALSDIFLGATALMAEYNGIGKASHVRDKLAELITVGELVYGAGIAASVKGFKSASGTFAPDVVFTNVGRYHAGTNIYHEFETLADIAGGLAATLPFEEDFYSPDTKDDLEKYIMRKSDVCAENQHRAYRLVENLIASSTGAATGISGIHGGGSPVMEKIAIMSKYDIQARKNVVKYLAGIKD